MGSPNPKRGALLLRALCREGEQVLGGIQGQESTELSSRPSSEAPTLEDLPSSSQLPLSCFSFTVITCRPVLGLRPSTGRAPTQEAWRSYLWLTGRSQCPLFPHAPHPQAQGRRAGLSHSPALPEPELVWLSLGHQATVTATEVHLKCQILLKEEKQRRH